MHFMGLFLLDDWSGKEMQENESLYARSEIWLLTSNCKSFSPLSHQRSKVIHHAREPRRWHVSVVAWPKYSKQKLMLSSSLHLHHTSNSPKWFTVWVSVDVSLFTETVWSTQIKEKCWRINKSIKWSRWRHAFICIWSFLMKHQLWMINLLINWTAWIYTHAAMV